MTERPVPKSVKRYIQKEEMRKTVCLTNMEFI